MSGYNWIEAETELYNSDRIVFASGWSYEQASQGKLLINHFGIEYKSGQHIFSIGDAVSMLGRLHHDLHDFGAPGLGIDNIPHSSFFRGSFTANTAQQITQPFANRIAYYGSPFSFLGVGISYTPYIAKDHPADFEYYTKADHTHEIAAAISFEESYRNRFMGATFGVTHARYAHDINFYQAGDASSRQFSFYLRDDLHSQKFRLYEMVWGCLKADRLEKDCRAGWQISTTEGRWTETHAYKKRVSSGYNYDDYSTGYMYKLGDNTDIGIRSILRIKQNKSLRDGAFHWNFGISHSF